MDHEISALNLAEDYAKVLNTSDATRWKLERPQLLEVWITMSPAAQPQEIFQARLLWTSYPDDPPSLKFRDRETGRLDLPQAWPKVRGFRPPSLDACVNYCSEGFALHPEWKSDPRLRWQSQGNVLLKVLRILQSELDDYFDGRHQ